MAVCGRGRCAAGLPNFCTLSLAVANARLYAAVASWCRRNSLKRRLFPIARRRRPESGGLCPGPLGAASGPNKGSGPFSTRNTRTGFSATAAPPRSFCAIVRGEVLHAGPRPRRGMPAWSAAVEEELQLCRLAEERERSERAHETTFLRAPAEQPEHLGAGTPEARGREDSPSPPPLDNPELASDAVYATRRYFQKASKERARSQTGQGKAAKIEEERSEDPRTWKQGLITGNMVLRDEVRRIEL